MSLLIIAGVVLINEARRNIPVSYAKRVRGMKMYGGVSTYLPLNINPAGVIPIIFALSILLFPGMIANFLGGAGGPVGTYCQKHWRLFSKILGFMGFYILFWLFFLLIFTLPLLLTQKPLLKIFKKWADLFRESDREKALPILCIIF